MEKLTFNKNFIIAKGGSERGELLEKFLLRLNQPRIEHGFKPISIGRLAKLLAHVPTDDLYSFYRECEKATNFSKFFWWSLKPKK